MPKNAFTRFLRTAFHAKNQDPITPPPIPIQLQMTKNGETIPLDDLTFSTRNKRLSDGLCFVELYYDYDTINGDEDDGRRLTFLSFVVDIIPGELSGKFTKLVLNVRLCSDLPDSGDVRLEADRYIGANAIAPTEMTSHAPAEILTSAVVVVEQPIFGNTPKITEEIYTPPSGGKGIIWTLDEDLDTDTMENRMWGVGGKHIFRLRTRTALPLRAEISVSARYLKGIRTKKFAVPGKDRFVEYKLVPTLW